MKLYYAPGTCALAPHIVLEEAGIPFELVRVDLPAKKLANGDDYLAINPRGYVPALELDDGEILTEANVIVRYLADTKPEAQLAPPYGTMARWRLEEWLAVIATELHKGFSPFFNAKLSDDAKSVLREKLVQRYDWLSTELAARPFLTADHFTVADAYLFTILRWGTPRNHMTVTQWPTLKSYFDRIAARPAVHRALQAQGLGTGSPR